MAGPRLENPFVLQRLETGSVSGFHTPRKKINDGDDLNFWLVSTAYRDLTIWLLQLNRAMFPSQQSDGAAKAYTLGMPTGSSPHVQGVRRIINSLSDLVMQAPPSTGPRRFGNVAFRDWFRLAEESVDRLLAEQLSDVFERWTANPGLNDELRSYLLGSLGSPQRLDYGTGHELSFLAFLGALWKLGKFEEGEERVIVIGLVQPYLDLMRKLIMTYTLEPAGSHGVWGLDDHNFAPYIFGSAQFGPAMDHANSTAPVPTEGSLASAPIPSDITKLDMVRDYRDSNMYFSAIAFIYDVKKGPFWEHSPVLYDVSGIKDGWGKINKGMLKMYAAEVLGKFPVVQHFPFGSIFAWQRDPWALQKTSSIHAAQQPPISKDAARPPPSNAGTNTRSSTTTAPMSSTRAPWATGDVSSGRRIPGAGPHSATTVPRASGDPRGK